MNQKRNIEMKKVLLKTIFCMLFFVVFSISSSAQWHLGVTTGYTYNAYHIDVGYAYDMRYEGRSGLTMGIPVQYDFCEWLAIRAELAYVQKGYKMHRTHQFEGLYTDTRDNYLSLPLMAHFSFGGKRLRGFLHAGGYIGQWLSRYRKGTESKVLSRPELLGQNIVIDRQNLYYFNTKVKFDSRCDKRFEAGLTGGIGINYQLTSRLEAQIEGRCYYGLTDTQKDYMITRSPRYNTTFTLQAGIGVLLGKNRLFRSLKFQAKQP